MTRKRLLISTALVLAGWATIVAAKPELATGSQLQNSIASHDANAEFLCNYGDLTVSSYFRDYSSSYYALGWTHVAVPIVGRDRTVNSITVAESGLNGLLFTVGVYSNTAGGFPGKLIAGGQGVTSSRCGKITISIPPTKLRGWKTYWIEETDSRSGSSVSDVYWAIDRRTKRRAYAQYHRYWREQSKSSSYTTPWTKLSAGPWFRLK